MEFALGMDVSRYQTLLDINNSVIGPIDFSKAKNQGVKYVAVRATVGDYYTDYALNSNYDGSKLQGLFTTFYHVVRPDISIIGQINRFFDALAGRVGDLPLVLDCEVSADQSPFTITNIIRGCVLEIADRDGRRPLIYTRQSWFDLNVNPDPDIKACDLWAARYISGLTSPWGDGYFKFRDWENWKIWQHSADGNGLGSLFGVKSASVDLDWFNGTEQDLLDYMGVQPPQEVNMYTLIDRKATSVLANAAYPANVSRLIVPPSEEWVVNWVAIHVNQQHTRLMIVVRTPPPNEDIKYVPLFDEYDTRPTRWYSVECGDLNLDPGYIIEAQVIGADKDSNLNIAVGGRKCVGEIIE